MSASGGNLYGRYRRAAGLTQERAAELLDCPVRTLANWEAGTYMPPDDRVVMMVDVYQAPTLAIEHLRSRSAMAAKLLPEVVGKPLAQAVLSLLVAMDEFEVCESDVQLMKIAADGKVSGEETRRMLLLLGQLSDIVQAAYEVRLACDREMGVTGDGKD